MNIIICDEFANDSLDRESDVKPVGVTLGVLLSCLLRGTVEGPANYSQPLVTPEHHPYQKKKNYMY